MKKVIALMILMMLCGCTSNGDVINNTASPTFSEENKEIIRAIEDNKEFETLSKVQWCEYDINMDGEDESISLLTDAKIDKKGHYMWDDSNSWCLVVKSKDGLYLLYDEHIHGDLDIHVSEYYNEDGTITPVIRLDVSSGAGFDITEYRFEGEGFSKKVVYTTGAINEISIEKN